VVVVGGVEPAFCCKFAGTNEPAENERSSGDVR